MLARTGPPTGSDGRLADRTNMFIAAALLADGASRPAKVRNMSPRGALVEAAVLPQQGRAIELVRGALRVTGDVVWRDEQRCGVRFRSAVVVADWLASCGRNGQQGVERRVSQLRMGAVPAEPATADTPADLSDDVARMRHLLDRLGDDLASDPDTLVRHASSLQTLDIAAQMLGALSDAVATDAATRTVGFRRLTQLRASALEALRP